MRDLQDIRTVPAADVSQRRFHDRVVIVTGAGGGIGAAKSARFADEGAHVIVCDANDTAAAVADNLPAAGYGHRQGFSTSPTPMRAVRSQNRPSASTRASTSWSTMPGLIAAAIYSHSATTIGRSPSRSTSMRCSTCAARFFPT